MIPAVFAALLLAAPAAAQVPRCGFGLGLQAFHRAERQAKAGIATEDLLPGRDAAEAAAAALAEAAGHFAGCGCQRIAELTQDAQRLAEQAQSETTQASLRRALERATVSLGLARDRLDRRGCS